MLRSVVVGIGFAIMLALVAFGTWDSWINTAVKLARTDEAHISSLLLTLFTEIRFFIVFLLLTPALAIHWTIKREQSKAKKIETHGAQSAPD